MRVLGIDPSLTSTGVAIVRRHHLSGELIVTTTRVESAPPKRARGDKRRATLTERFDRIRGIVAGLPPTAHVSHYDGQVVAVIEAPSYGSQGASTWDRAWLWGAIVDRLLANDIPVALVPPRTRALWAAGSGSASKSPIAVHMSRMWPDVDPAISDDEWDALALATMGAQHLGVAPVELVRHREQLAKVEWPDFPAPAVAS